MPPLVFIFIFYFLPSNQLMPMTGIGKRASCDSPTVQAIITNLSDDQVFFPNFVSGLICLNPFEGVYIAEIVRAGIQSISRGQ